MTQSVDPDFARRVAEYQAKAKKGVVFQADGTVGGRVARPSRAAWRSRPFLFLLKILVVLMVIKAITFHVASVWGISAYSGVILDHELPIQRAAVLVLYPDPISVTISKYLHIGQEFIADEARKIL